MLEGRLRVRRREDRTFHFSLQFLPAVSFGGAWPEAFFGSESSIFNFLKRPPLSLRIEDWIPFITINNRGHFRVLSSNQFEVRLEEDSNHKNLDSSEFWDFIKNDFEIPTIWISVEWGIENELLPPNFPSQ